MKFDVIRSMTETYVQAENSRVVYYGITVSLKAKAVNIYMLVIPFP